MLNKIINDILISLSYTLENLQYSLLYAIIGIPLAYYNNIVFTPLDENKPVNYIMYEILLQILLMTLMFYLMKNIVMRIPYLFSFITKYYKPYSTDEYIGAAVGAYTVFFYLQIHLTEKLDYLAHQLFQNKISWYRLLF